MRRIPLRRIQLVFSVFCNHGRNLDSALYTGNEIAVKTVDCTRPTGFEEGEMCSIRWKGNGLSFWGANGIFLMNNVEKGKNILEYPRKGVISQ